VAWNGGKMKNCQDLSPNPASEGNVTQSIAIAPLHLLRAISMIEELATSDLIIIPTNFIAAVAAG
jgi:hypothetical protein